VTDSKELVLDANILLRGTLGAAVSNLLLRFSNSMDFYVPDVALADARRHISALAARLQVEPDELFIKLDRLKAMVHVVHGADYQTYELAATSRIRSRDLSDWPLIATCLLLNAPLWTEDRDFFGCGIATWTTNNVGIYLRGE